MEPETKDFLVRIIQTISMVLLWMMLNVFFGIYKELGFFEGEPRWYNYLYYILFVSTLLWLARYVIRKWK